MADEKIKQLLKEVRQGKKVPNLSVQNVLPNFIEVEFGEKISAITNPQERQQYRDSLTSYYASGAGRATIEAIISDMEYQYARALNILTGVAIPSNNGGGGGGGGTVNVVDDLTSTSATDALSANQGRLLKSYIDAGYIFKGFATLATNPGAATTPYPVCYIGVESGQYVDFYGMPTVTLQPGQIAFFTRPKNNNIWSITTYTIGGGGGTVVDNLTSTSTTSALSANQGRVIKSIIDAGYVFKGFLHPEDDGTAVCDYPVCYLTGISGVYYGYSYLNINLSNGQLALIYRPKNSTHWDYVTTTISGSGGGGYIGYSVVQTTAGPQSLFGITYLNATNSASSGSRIIWDTTNNAWHFYGNIYADGWIAAGGIGSGGGGGGGSTVVVTQRLTSGTPIADIEVDGETTTLYAPSGGGGGGGGYIGYTAVQQNAQSQSLFGIPYLNATNTASSASRMVWDSTRNAWHFYGNIYADGWISSGGVGSGSSGSSSVLDDLLDVELSSPTNGQALVYRNGTWRNETVSGGGGGGTGVTRVAMTVPTSELSVSGTPITTEGTLALSWVNQSQNKVLASPVNTTGTPSFRALVTADIPDLSGKYVTLDTTQNNISGAKTFITNPLTIGQSSGLKVDGGSYIDLGDARLVWDATNHAIHITKRPGSSYTGDIGVYVDGFMASGGIQ